MLDREPTLFDRTWLSLFIAAAILVCAAAIEGCSARRRTATGAPAIESCIAYCAPEAVAYWCKGSCVWPWSDDRICRCEAAR